MTVFQQIHLPGKARCLILEWPQRGRFDNSKEFRANLRSLSSRVMPVSQRPVAKEAGRQHMRRGLGTSRQSWGAQA